MAALFSLGFVRFCASSIFDLLSSIFYRLLSMSATKPDEEFTESLALY